jgi:hypothetical protein
VGSASTGTAARVPTNRTWSRVRVARCSSRQGARRVVRSAEPPQQAGQAAERDAARSGVVFWLGRDQRAQQRGHRRPFVGEHPDIALRADQRERRARDIQRARLLTRGRQRQYLQCLDLDDAASVLLSPVHP